MGEAQVAKLLGGARVFGRGPTNRLRIADVLEKGLPNESLERIKKALMLTDVQLAHAIGVNQKTIGRLRSNPSRHLGVSESDRLYRVARIFSQAVDVFEDEESARKWLRSPQIGLGKRIPLELLSTEAGSREVEDLLGRIEYGVLS